MHDLTNTRDHQALLAAALHDEVDHLEPRPLLSEILAAAPHRSWAWLWLLLAARHHPATHHPPAGGMTMSTASTSANTPPLRVRATAAARLGIPLAEYDRRIATGEKWCGGCRQWHPRTSFSRDRTRGDGLSKWCRDYSSARAKAIYRPRPRPESGRRYVPARNGDGRQARRRVNYLIDAGILPRPSDVPCTDCGHVWTEGERRHEYDHHRGYAPEHHEDVEAVCTTCHRRREAERRAA
jgi:hypothetical protein